MDSDCAFGIFKLFLEFVLTENDKDADVTSEDSRQE
jgi:hypothetical protein